MILLPLLLVPCAAAGLALMSAGLCRARNAAHAMMTALCVAATASLSWFAIGFAIQGYAGGPSYILTVAGHSWDWLGHERVLLWGANFKSSPVFGVIWGMLTVVVAAIVPLGSGAERWRLGAACAIQMFGSQYRIVRKDRGRCTVQFALSCVGE